MEFFLPLLSANSPVTSCSSELNAVQMLIISPIIGTEPPRLSM